MAEKAEPKTEPETDEKDDKPVKASIKEQGRTFNAPGIERQK